MKNRIFIRLSVLRVLGLLSLVVSLLTFSGCIRLTGTAGYTKVKEDEVVTKEAGFDLDSARLMQKSNQS